ASLSVSEAITRRSVRISWLPRPAALTAACGKLLRKPAIQQLPRRHKPIVLRILRDPDGVLAREVGVTKTMKRRRGSISNRGGRPVRTIRCFAYRTVRWAGGGRKI